MLLGNDLAKDPLDEWIYFLKNEEIQDGFQAKGLKKAKEALNVMKLSESERKAYEYYIDQLSRERSRVASSYDSGHSDGRQEGFVEGEQSGLEKGEKIGIEKGEKIGIEKGKLIGQIQLLQDMLPEPMSFPKGWEDQDEAQLATWITDLKERLSLVR